MLIRGVPLNVRVGAYIGSVTGRSGSGTRHKAPSLRGLKQKEGPHMTSIRRSVTLCLLIFGEIAMNDRRAAEKASFERVQAAVAELEKTVKLNQIPAAVRPWLLIVNTVLFAIFVWVASDAADGLRSIANAIASVSL